MGRRKAIASNSAEEMINSKEVKKSKKSETEVPTDGLYSGRQTRGRTKKDEMTSNMTVKEIEESSIQCKTNKILKSEETNKTKLVGKKVRPKKGSKTETKLQLDVQSPSSIIVKEEKYEGKSKQSKRKLAKEEINEEEEEEESPPKIAKKANSSKGKQKPKVEKIEDNNNCKEEIIDDEESLPKNAKKAKSTKGKEKTKAKKIEDNKSKGMMRSVVKKGLAAVDGLCPIASSSHVYTENGDIWDCMLNQTNIQFNNNKYYIIQLLKDDNKNAYSVWMRWGRVGCPGQNSLKPFGQNLDKAKETFEKKFSDKTKNEWEERDMFEKVFGKYDLLKMDYSGDDVVDNTVKKEDEDSKKPMKKVESKLHEKLKALIELICNVKAMEEAVIEMKYDPKKAPLGKLTSEQVKAGYAALKKIESVILGSGKSSNKDLVEACNAFYTRVPHYFGMKTPPLIRTRQEIQEKLSLLQALGDIQAAMNVINQPLLEGTHPVDQHYEGLKCDINPLKKEDSVYQMLEKYLLTTHGKTHSMYKIKVLEIFEAVKMGEESRFNDVGNRMLLWHGSRLTNWAGILSQGLRIAPPEAPTTGYMFGKGIYFADMASKSANYCMPSYQNKTGLLVLCDVSLGKCKELLNADCNANKLPSGYQSVKGLGKTAPDPKNFVTLPDGSVIPMGPGVDTKVDNKSGYTLQYNEYIVYDVSQVKIKYLFKIEFDFK